MSEGRGSEGRQQRPQSLSGSRWTESRWDSTGLPKFEYTGQADRGEERARVKLSGVDGRAGWDTGRAGRDTWQIRPKLEL